MAALLQKHKYLKRIGILVSSMKFLHHRILKITQFTGWMQHMDLHSEVLTLQVPKNKCLYVNTIKTTSQNLYSLSSIVWTLKSTKIQGNEYETNWADKK